MQWVHHTISGKKNCSIYYHHKFVSFVTAHLDVVSVQIAGEDRSDPAIRYATGHWTLHPWEELKQNNTSTDGYIHGARVGGYETVV